MARGFRLFDASHIWPRKYSAATGSPVRVSVDPQLRDVFDLLVGQFQRVTVMGVGRRKGRGIFFRARARFRASKRLSAATIGARKPDTAPRTAQKRIQRIRASNIVRVQLSSLTRVNRADLSV